MGQWADNMMNGEVVCQWKNGERFEGTYKNHKRNGNGTFYYTDGWKAFCLWVNDEHVDPCVFTKSNGEQYNKQDSTNNILHGNNTYNHVDESKHMAKDVNGSRYEELLLDRKLRAMKQLPMVAANRA
jgi:hypothetical protein